MKLPAAVLKRLRTRLPTQGWSSITSVLGQLQSPLSAIQLPTGYADDGNSDLANLGAQLLGAFANAVVHKKMAETGLDKDLDIANPSLSDTVNQIVDGLSNSFKPDDKPTPSDPFPPDEWGRRWGDPDYGKQPHFDLPGGPSPTTDSSDTSSSAEDTTDPEQATDDEENPDNVDWEPGGPQTGTAYDPEGDSGSSKKRRPGIRGPNPASMPNPDSDGGPLGPAARFGTVGWLNGLIGNGALQQLMSGRS